MEENMAILLADLSGYTALTEVHGSFSAADLIDKYVQIAKTSLVGNCHLHERNGDEIMIVSTSANALLETALLISKSTSREENFLQVHQGLHYGKVLKRGSSYFGSAINLTARIATLADAGTISCSAEYLRELIGHSQYKLQSKGFKQFKNVKDNKEIFEVLTDDRQELYIDSVCRMLIQNRSKAIAHPFEQEKYFCSSQCLDIYTARHV